jgi:5,10-methylenetetrahydromethanopterin reductase
MELWAAWVNMPGEAANMARQAKREGFDGISMGDTQSFAADPYVGLMAAAIAAPQLKLMVGVTNPVTRHPSVTACAIASVHVESGGRTVLGIGRGDSAVSKFGLRASSLREFEQYLARVQGYLRGECVEIDGKESRLEWLQESSLPKVPVDVAATGPGVSAAAARRADRITFNLGANRERIANGIKLAREARKDAGLPADDLSFGAYLTVAPHPDIAAGREMIKTVATVYARFQAMPGHPPNELRPEDAKVIEAVGAHYDSSLHGTRTEVMDDGFIERFGVVGSADQCVEKLTGLMRLGLDRLIMTRPNPLAPPEHLAESSRLISQIVLPELRRTVVAR